MTITVKKDNVVALEHDIRSVSSSNGYTSVFLTGGLIVLNLLVNEFVEVQIFDEGQSVLHMLATFESYQFNMSSYISNGNDGNPVGSTQNGVTNNSLVFKNLKMLEN